MRRETGEALLVNSPHLRPGGPPLSLLAGRIAQSRGRTVTGTAGPPPPAHVTRPATERPLTPPSAGRLRREAAPALSLPAPGLVSAPPPGRTLGSCADPAGTVALLGAHGGAGVTSLLRAGLDQVAVDAGRCWPRAGLVLLVARTSISGLEWARDLARQHASGGAGDVDLLGLVLVPDASGRLPARTSGLRDLMSGAFGRTWHLPWIEPWRLAATTEPLPAHPAVQQLLAELAHTWQLPIRQRSRPDLSRTARAPGAPVSTTLTALVASSTLLAADINVPASVQPPGTAGLLTVLGWGAWIVTLVCIAGIFAVAAKMAFAHRRGEGSEAVGQLGWVMGACVLIAAAGPIVNLLV